MPIYKANGKKDGLQKYNVRVNYISDSGEPKQLTRTAYGNDNAKTLEMQLINEIKIKGEQRIKKMTVQELFEEYIEMKTKIVFSVYRPIVMERVKQARQNNVH